MLHEIPGVLHRNSLAWSKWLVSVSHTVMLVSSFPLSFKPDLSESLHRFFPQNMFHVYLLLFPLPSSGLKLS